MTLIDPIPAQRTIGVQLAASSSDFPTQTHGLLCEIKEDGFRVRAVLDDHHRVQILLGRELTDRTGQLPYLEQTLKALLPPNTVLDGELTDPACGFAGVSAVMGSRLTHMPDPGGELHLVVFDVLAWAATPLHDHPQSVRSHHVDTLPQAPTLRRVRRLPPTRAAYEQAIAAGEEGVVLKHPDHPYRATRNAWVKVKPTSTHDAVVLDILHGSGRNTGRPQTLVVDLLDPSGAPSGRTIRASGLSDQEKDLAHSWIGQVVEIQSNGTTSTGLPRHPRFLRLRSDRSARPSSPRTSTPTAPAATGAWVRNYAACGTAKLARILAELEAGEGDAVDRIHSKGGDLQLNLQRAREAARAKGLL
ncbi:hypothetical protein GKE82_23440 [Conexibacter sp. W3-3-2]|uniref:ATP-dependent DNA ligase n=1 Tax=Conexibacter sp. W3-3-2 TaxID=2675227 RepID=UPI0012B99CFF|nr:ATP-dependent DNA ligase [Conexibacter sp. W3-3-2]MTD47159.1 hypothetical protein [Conexibacter sp. W3-3-2]